MTAAHTPRERFSAVTASLLETHERLALVLADIGVSQFAAHGVFAKFPERVFNLGIREQLLVSFAGGLASVGLRPVVHTYAPFLVERAFEQVRLDLGHQDLGAVLVSVGASVDSSGAGRTHQAPEDVALLATLPGWTIHTPGHPDEVEAMLRSAALTDDRVYIRLSERTNRRAYEPGRVHEVVSSASAHGVLAIGPMLEPVLEASREMPVRVLYTATPRPLRQDDVNAALSGLRSILVVEPFLEGTMAADLCDCLSSRAIRFGFAGFPRAEHRHYGSPEEHLAAHGLDGAGIRRRIRKIIDRAG